MAALKNHGIEIARLRRQVHPPHDPWPLETVVSVRSHGTFLKSSRWLQSPGQPFKYNHAWKVWLRFHPFDEYQANTPPQQVRTLLERGFEFVAGDMDKVTNSWHALCNRKRKSA